MATGNAGEGAGSNTDKKNQKWSFPHHSFLQLPVAVNNIPRRCRNHIYLFGAPARSALRGVLCDLLAARTFARTCGNRPRRASKSPRTAHGSISAWQSQLLLRRRATHSTWLQKQQYTLPMTQPATQGCPPPAPRWSAASASQTRPSRPSRHARASAAMRAT